MCLINVKGLASFLYYLKYINEQQNAGHLILYPNVEQSGTFIQWEFQDNFIHLINKFQGDKF